MNNFQAKEVEVDLEKILDEYEKFTYFLGNYGHRKVDKKIKIAPFESLAFIKRV